MGDSTINANAQDKQTEAQCQKVPAELYFGIFFDGTNNNKVQTMLAYAHRRNLFFNEHKEDILRYFPDAKDISSINREELEIRGIGTPDELDNVFLSNDKNTKLCLDFEKSIAADNSNEYRYSTAAEKYRSTKKRTWAGRIIKNYLIEGPRAERVSRAAGNEADRFLFFSRQWSIAPAKGSSYTNIAILNSLYATSNPEEDEKSEGLVERHYTIYVEGSGADEEISVVKQIASFKDTLVGLAFGVDEKGIVAKCRKVIHRVQEIYDKYMMSNSHDTINCHFDIFGFSRGATTARCFTYVLNPQKNRGYINMAINERICGTKDEFLGRGTKFLGKKNVRKLGLYDTVSSLGVLREGSGYILGEQAFKMSSKEEFIKTQSIFHDTNVDDFGLYSTNQADEVLHICALDEYRKNFALVDIKSSLASNGREIFIPGCHTDIGGGASIGLDAFKIINCDEISTRGDILFNLYLRIESLIEIVEGLTQAAKSISATSAALGNLASAPIAYQSIKEFVPGLHKAIKGLFSLTSGYESLNAYKIEHGTSKRKKVDDSGEEENKAYSLIADTVNLANNFKETPRKLPSVAQGIKSKAGSLRVKSMKGKIQTVVELVQMGKMLADILMSLYEAIKRLVTDLNKLDDPANPHTLKDDIAAIIEPEIKFWQTQIVLVKECNEMFGYIFDGDKKPILIPIEQRRICMFTGVPNIDKPIDTEMLQKMSVPVSVSSLQELGWIKDITEETETTWLNGRPTEKSIKKARKTGRSIVVDKTKVAHFFTRNNIGIQKYSKPGYHIIGLNAMYKWANEGTLMFNAFPSVRFHLNGDLEAFSSLVEQQTKGKGRKVCVPTHPEYTYKYLRQNYLHISINQQILSIADNGVVNGPSFMTIPTSLSEDERDKLISTKTLISRRESYNKDNVITRRIYPGEKNSNAAGGKDYQTFPTRQYWYLG